MDELSEFTEALVRSSDIARVSYMLAQSHMYASRVSVFVVDGSNESTEGTLET